jgi:hypothetical protein
MAYDRFDPSNERNRRPDDRYSDQGPERGDHRGGERGFFERAGEEISSWFGGGSDDDHRGNPDDRQRGQQHGDWNQGRSTSSGGGYSERDYNPSWRSGLRDHGQERSFGQREDYRERNFGGGDHRESGYRPVTGDYGRGGQRERGFGGYDRESGRSETPWGRDDYRNSSRAGTRDQSDRSRHDRQSDFDPHYQSLRERHISDLDRDYDEYRRENQSRFESEFGTWRERRQQKRGLLGQIREQMQVIGNDQQPIGTVERVAGDRLILAKADESEGGAHHSISCAHIERVEADQVMLECSADDARKHWRDEDRSRALFEREDQGEMGAHALDRSFSGTYR